MTEIKPVRMFAARNCSDRRAVTCVNWHAKNVRHEMGSIRNPDDPRQGWQQAKRDGWYVGAVVVFPDMGGRYVI